MPGRDGGVAGVMTQPAQEDVETRLARTLGLPETTVRGADIPPMMLNDLFNRASKAETTSKWLKRGGLAVLALTAVLTAVGLGAAKGEEGLGALAVAVVVFEAATWGVIAGAAATGAGFLFDGRRSIRNTVNALAMGRLARLDAQSRAGIVAPASTAEPGGQTLAP